MKKGKLLILLTLALAFTLAACDETEKEQYADDGKIADVKIEQADEKHEMNSYFNLGDDAKHIYSSISRIEGKPVDIDTEHCLAVVETKDLDNMNNVTKTVNVIDLVSGQTILTETVTNQYGAPDEEMRLLEVTVEYPVIKVLRRSQGLGDEAAFEYNVTYYAAKAGAHHLGSAATDDHDIMKYDNGLYAVRINESIAWLDKNLDVIRTSTVSLTGDYDFESFDSEYMGYLYSWNSYELLIFNRSGMVSGRYTADEDEAFRAFVLDNGNVLIQSYIISENGDPYDLELDGARYKVKSFVMGLVDGAVTEVKLDYIVSELRSAYGQIYGGTNGFTLADGMKNRAVIHRLSGGKVSPAAELCVLDNDLNVLYSVKNDTLGVVMEGASYMGNGIYRATVQAEGSNSSALFDLNGRLVSMYDISGMTDKYLVTDKAIYDYGMNKLYDIELNGFELASIANDNIYLEKDNFVTGSTETYIVTPASSAPELLCDGIKSEFVDAANGISIIYDIENDAYRVYNAHGEELLVSHEDVVESAVFENMIMLSSSFNGEPIVYIVK